MAQPTPFDLQAKPSWPTVFWYRIWKDHSTEAPVLIKYLYELKEKQEQPIASGIAPSMKSASGLYESDFDLFKLEHPSIRKLGTFIAASVREVVSKMNGGEHKPQEIEVHINDGWYHITNDGGFHDTHSHCSCSWCGIYYVQIGQSGRKDKSKAPNGGNRFYSPLNQGGMAMDYGNKYLDHGIIDPPMQDGMLLLFPSYLLHSGLPYQGEKDRIVIAFNTQSFLKQKQGQPIA